MTSRRRSATTGVHRDVHAAYRRDEQKCLAPLVAHARLPTQTADRVLERARALARRYRELQSDHGGMEALLQEYDLSSEEGVLLMCLAEALLRIPDRQTQDRLIRDKLSQGQWDSHLRHSHSLFVNASTWGLMMTERVITFTGDEHDAGARLRRLAARAGAGAVRLALLEAMNLLARSFVMGATVKDALDRAPAGRRYSFDCLGEAARGASDVARYLQAYRHAIEVIAPRATDPLTGPGISVKLSALHPRYEYAQRDRVLAELVPRLRDLAARARDADMGLTIDAEESDRLGLSLEIFETVYRDPAMDGWAGLGLAVQAYQKRAPAVLAWLADLGREVGRRIPLRLVKGAYWDSEIKRAQQQGLDGYPVFTRKAATDVSYLACARFLLTHRDTFYPQFATHNAHTAAYVLAVAGQQRDFEFQRLHGMGEALYQALEEQCKPPVPCRIYAPVGAHEALLPYLVRRLLENGANTSFVNRLADRHRPVEQVVTDPVAHVTRVRCAPHPRIPLPADLYDGRRNAAGVDLGDPLQLMPLEADLQAALAKSWSAAPRTGGRPFPGPTRPVTDPADRRRVIGEVNEASPEALEHALALAQRSAPQWDAVNADTRAQYLERAADAFEQHRAELMALIIREGGRTLGDALQELREAVDFLRYYALQARLHFAEPRRLPGPAGEDNRLHLHGRGVFACISPWNFPLAIFTGQVAAALAAGNAVIAKPARQTPLTACRAVELLYEAGIPEGVLHFLPGSAAVLGDPLLADPRLSGVAMTGSTDTARAMQTALAARGGPIVPLIAETGGQNAMIVDSSALPEQVVADAAASAFNSAGQRCSALRVLFLQEDVADRVLDLLAEAMDELTIGNPARLSTDVGPVIDETACRPLQEHVEHLTIRGVLRKTTGLPDAARHGSFFAPHLFEIPDAGVLQGEVFGPVLHVVRFRAGELDRVIDGINATGYGLTLGVHSRIERTWQRVRERARVGNLYVNRNIIGSVVGVQPFGGEGLSGTGPKAGGPHYLPRFATERTCTVNTAAIGGNRGLLSLDE